MRDSQKLIDELAQQNVVNPMMVRAVLSLEYGSVALDPSQVEAFFEELKTSGCLRWLRIGDRRYRPLEKLDEFAQRYKGDTTGVYAKKLWARYQELRRNS